jgi:hypothetical protein
MNTFERGSTQKHQNLVKAFPVAACHAFDDIVVIPYTVGMFRDFELAERIIHAGLKGVPDLLVLGCGFYLFFDAKTGKAKFTKEQAAFKERIKQINKNMDHVYKLTNIEQGLDIIKEARKFYAR